MASVHQVYLFGDQTYNVEQSLRSLLALDNVLLVSFFDQTHRALRHEVGRLPLHLRVHVPRFNSITDILTRKRDGNAGPALEQAICVIHAFACFIRRHSDEELAYPSPESTHFAGLCTGALAAAAISTSGDLLDLIPVAVQTVVIAFHVGLRAAEVAKSLAGDSVHSSWAMIVPGLSSETMTQVRQDFCSRMSVSKLSSPFITAHSAAGVTVSGPPETLATLRKSLGTAANAPLPITAPYHAPHLFGDEDVSVLLGGRTFPHQSTDTTAIPVISFGTGHPVWAGSSHTMIQEAVKDILLRPIVWDRTVDRLGELIKSKPVSKVQIIQIGTHAGDALQRRLNQALPGINVTAESANSTLTFPNAATRHGKRPKLAVIGMNGRFPKASSPEALWELLMNKVDTCEEVPKLRWNADTHVDPTGKAKNTSKIRWGCWLDDPDMFDAKFFSMSPREAPQVDPAQRLALMTAYEAMENAGLTPGQTPSTKEDRVGVFFGTTSNDWCEANSGQDIDTYYIPGANRAFIPGRINYCFKFTGPSYSVDTACSSSLSALHIACNSLWTGDIDTAIVGGTNVLTNPDMTAGLDRGHFLSETGNCKTFDASADGYCRGEGVATVILKRLEDAIEDDDPIHGIIGGAYTNHSAEAESITRPHVGAQKSIFERVLNDSGTHPYEVGYIEMHGTGTQAGDSREMQSVLDIFAPEQAIQRRAAEQPLHLGALKSNIGHGESVSGVSALIKVLMMMKNNAIPPHCGIKTTINPRFPTNLSERNVHIALEATTWQRAGDIPRKAIINNFSAAGGNSCVLVEDCPNTLRRGQLPVEADVDRAHFPIAVSARTPASLKGNLQSLVSYLSTKDCSTVALSQLSYTSTARRMHHQYRIMVSAVSIEDAKRKLEDALAQAQSMPRPVPPKHVLFAFTGQGSQYPGMARQLFESLSVFRERLVHFDRLCQRLGFPQILSLFTASGGPNIADYQPVVVQLANTCMQIALAAVWMSWGIMPTAVVGHSLGEYAALNIAGVLSDADTICLVGRRAQLLQETCDKGTHSMLAVLAPASKILEIARGEVFEIACINGPEETVLAGTCQNIAKVQQSLAKAGIKNTLLKVPYAFHSSQVDPILATFTSDSRACVFHKPRIPVISTLLGKVVTEEGTFGAEYIARHAREPVNMLKAMRTASEDGLVGKSSLGIEFGPHPVVSGMIKATLGPEATILPTLRRNQDTWEILTATLSSLYNAGISLKWTEFFRDIPSARVVLHLPAYSWDLQSFWIQYRNDWTLTKGDIAPGSAVPGSKREPSTTIKAEPSGFSKKPKVAPKEIPTLETTCIHKIANEKTEQGKFTITVESDVSRTDLNPLMQGHKVEGIGLCTPSVYADIAFTLGDYLLKRFEPAFPERVVDVTNMVIEKALIATGKQVQILRVTAVVDWNARSAECRFATADSNGNEVVQHSTCQIKFVDDALQGRLQRDLDATKENFARMRRQCLDGKTFRFNGPMAYNMVQALADFHQDYRCIDETIYDNDAYEAACTVSFGQMKKGGVFHTHPGAIDGLTQSGGFIMNANEKTDLQHEVFVNHGWDSFQIFEKIRNDCQYQTHVRMQPAENKQWKGDIVVFAADRVVASIRGVCLQGVPRRILKYILTSSAAPAKTKATGANDRHAQKPQQLPGPKQVQPVQAKAAVPAALSGTESQHAPSTQSTSSQGEESDLKDDVNLTDIGVDSLLSLTIAGAFSEELDVEADSSLFLDHPTVGDIKRFFRGCGAEVSVPIAVSAPPQVSHNSTPQPLAESSATEKGADSRCTSHREVHAILPQPSATISLHEQARKIIAEESGVGLSNLTDDANLADVGVDSLLSLVIGGRFREELGVDFEPEALLAECESIADIKRMLGGSDDSTQTQTATLQEHCTAPVPTMVERESQILLSSSNDYEAVGCGANPNEQDAEDSDTDASQPRTPPNAYENSQMFSAALQIIAEETRVKPADLDSDTVLLDIGVDSLLTLVIGGRLREELDLELDLELMLADMGTLGDLKNALESLNPPSRASIASSSSSQSGSNTSLDSSGVRALASDTDMTPSSSTGRRTPEMVQPTTSVILQGSQKTASRTLFFFPDGSGSAASYAYLPNIAKDLVVIGLNSPYLKTGDEMCCTWDELVCSYIAEVRRRQPHGPYNFAGWSAGGMLAFRAAQLLLQAGETVRDLILLDAPAPEGLGELPKHFYEWCERAELFKPSGKTPKWLIPHFKAMNRVLHTYHGSPLPNAALRKVHVLWAERSVMDDSKAPPMETRPDDTPDMHFLTKARTDFTAGAWARLFPGTVIEVEKATGVNHFTMLRDDHAGKVSSWIAAALQ